MGQSWMIGRSGGSTSVAQSSMLAGLPCSPVLVSDKLVESVTDHQAFRLKGATLPILGEAAQVGITNYCQITVVKTVIQ